MSSQSESEQPTLLPCPDCNRPTDSLKVFTLPVIVFFIVGAWSQRKKAAACPECMRKRVLAMSATNIVTTHIMWPFVVLPMTLIQLWITTRPGHSDDVIKLAAAQGIAVSRGSAAAWRREPVPWIRRIAGVGKIVNGGIVAFFASYFLMEQWFRWQGRGTAWTWGAIVAVAVGVACAIILSGVFNLRLAVLSWKSWAIACVAGGSIFLASAPLLARSYWSSEGAEALASGDVSHYWYSVPPEVWSVAGATKLLDWKADNLAKEAEQSGGVPVWAGELAWDDLKQLLGNLEEHHGSDPDFAALITRTKETLQKYKQYDLTNAGGMADTKMMAPTGIDVDAKPGVVSPVESSDNKGPSDDTGPIDAKGPETAPPPVEWDSK